MNTIFNGATRASHLLRSFDCSLSHGASHTIHEFDINLKFLKDIETVNSKYFILAHDIKNLGQVQNKTLKLDRTTSTKQNSQT